MDMKGVKPLAPSRNFLWKKVIKPKHRLPFPSQKLPNAIPWILNPFDLFSIQTFDISDFKTVLFVLPNPGAWCISGLLPLSRDPDRRETSWRSERWRRRRRSDKRSVSERNFRRMATLEIWRRKTEKKEIDSK